MRERIDFFDAWRSVAVLLMIGYHFAFDLAKFGLVSGVMGTASARGVYYFGAYSFILMAGVSSNMSHSNIRRGIRLLGAGLAVSAASFFYGDVILFGVLHFMGVSAIIYGLLEKKLRKVKPGVLAPAALLALFYLTGRIVPEINTGVKFLWPLGFTYDGFYSADYYPLLPWIFLFFTGAWLGRALLEGGNDSLLTKKYPVWLTWCGRHSLVIYILHQPVLYGICSLLSAAGG